MFENFCPSCFLSFLFVLFIGYLIVRYLLEQSTLSDLEHRAVFISGCDTGFGRESALKLTQKGCLVFAGCLTKEVFGEYYQP